MPTPSRYTNELGARIRREYENGLSVQAVAELIGVAYATARSWLRRAGASMRQPGVRLTPNTGPSIAGRALSKPVRTQCKLCRHAILAGQPARWSTSPMGLVHEECPSVGH